MKNILALLIRKLVVLMVLYEKDFTIKYQDVDKVKYRTSKSLILIMSVQRNYGMNRKDERFF